MAKAQRSGLRQCQRALRGGQRLLRIETRTGEESHALSGFGSGKARVRTETTRLCRQGFKLARRGLRDGPDGGHFLPVGGQCADTATQRLDADNHRRQTGRRADNRALHAAHGPGCALGGPGHAIKGAVSLIYL